MTFANERSTWGINERRLSNQPIVKKGTGLGKNNVRKALALAQTPELAYLRTSSPAEREALAAFKAGKMKPIVRKHFPKEVVEERLGQLADYVISRVRKNDRSRISRERLIQQLRARLLPLPLHELVVGEKPNDW